MTEKSTSTLIIGAGPAGLQLAYHLEKAGRDYLVLERGDGAGTFFARFPRHRTLISSNKVYTGYTEPERRMRFDWNSLLTDDYDHLFRQYTKRYFAPADEMVRYLRDFAERYVHRIEYGVSVTKISKHGGQFHVTASNGNMYSCSRLVMATGNSKPYMPNIPGIELAETYNEVSTVPEEFCDQRVLIIGKGNSGFETAENLIETAAMIHIVSPHPLRFAWTTHFPGNLRAVNNNFLDTYQLKSQNAVIDAEIRSIRRTDDGKLRVFFAYSHAHGETEEIPYDRVIACTGFRFDAELFDDTCRPELTINNRFPMQTSSWESSNVPELYFAGAPTQMRDYRKTNSAFIHGFRYNTRALFRILEQKYEQQAWPSTVVKTTPDDYTDTVLLRINRSSGLWQQFGFMCDALIVQEPGQECRLYEEMPVEYLQEKLLASAAECHVVTLEFGEHQPDPFHIVRDARPEMADKSTFLHPVIRSYHRGQKVGEMHLLENLLGEWENEELHIKPLRQYFQHLPVAGESVLAATN